MMKALVLDRYGSADNFRLADIAVPEPKAGEVRLRVRASSINSWDWELARGDLVARMAAPPKKPARVLGGDVAGVIDALGDGVTGFAVGDEVYGDATGSGWGGFAEFATVKVDAVRRIPEGLDFIRASTLPQAGVLAYQAVNRVALGPGSDVLVIGGGGGVGSFAIQLAKLKGARVTSIDTLHKAETMARAGADVVLDRHETDPETEPARYDLVVEPVLRRSVRAQFGLLKPGGAYASVGGHYGVLIRTMLFAPMLSRFGGEGRSSGLVMWNPKGDELDELARLVLSGAVFPMIENIYPLAQGVDAMRHFASGRALGKLVIMPQEA